MIFDVFGVSVIACRRQQMYKLMFCTFILNKQKHGVCRWFWVVLCI